MSRSKQPDGAISSALITRLRSRSPRIDQPSTLRRNRSMTKARNSPH